MPKTIATFLVGCIFGLGIAISGMANPAKVANFFDIAGSWDPSLIFVMAGALAVTAIGYRILFSRADRPVFDTAFHLPTRTGIDARLVAGAATFGVGWGIAGFCPGGAIPALGLGDISAYAFVAAMVAGIVIARTLDRIRMKPAGAF